MVSSDRLSEQDQKMLDAIQDFWIRYGYAPTSRDLVGVGGLRSHSNISLHLHRLRRGGHIVYENGLSRTIRLVVDRAGLVDQLLQTFERLGARWPDEAQTQIQEAAIYFLDMAALHPSH